MLLIEGQFCEWVRGWFGVADGFVRSSWRDGMTRGGWAKLLLKSEDGEPPYDSAKRTHRFPGRKDGLSDCEAKRSGGVILSSFGGFVFRNEAIGRMFLVDIGVDLLCLGQFLEFSLLANATERRGFMGDKSQRSLKAAATGRSRSISWETFGRLKVRGRRPSHNLGRSNRCAGGNICPLLVW